MVGFPLMIDSGSEVMPDDAVQALYEWVEAGGTYIALPFSGRSSVLDPDSWPITRLTGCGIAALRQPGQGSVVFKADQTFFKAMAGKSFPDAGRSLDYIGNNLNKLSIELKPGPDCDVLASFDNGAPAIVRRKLGAGQVIVLGTAFWRQCEDRNGIWWPESLETEFFADLLDGAGLPPAACTTDDRLGSAVAPARAEGQLGR